MEGEAEGYRRAEVEVNGQSERGFLVYGAPVGSKEYVSHMLQLRAQEIVDDAAKVADVLRNERQALWAVLRWSINQRFDYWSQLCPPSLTEPVARWLDSKLWMLLERVAGQMIPRAANHLGPTVQVPVQSRNRLTVPEQLVRLPVALGGLGFRGLEDTCAPAFIGGLLPASPYLAAVPALQEAWGGLGENWEEESSPLDRFTSFVESDVVAGLEMKKAWEKMQKEDQEACGWLDEQYGGPLVQEVAGAGEGSSSGKIRGQIMERREGLRLKILLKGLKEHPDQTWRPVWSLPERDKLSSAWVLCLPSAHLAMTPSEFSQVFSNHLLLPSPVCANRVGEPLPGGKKVDLYGDMVSSATLPGNGHKAKHDEMKNFLDSKMRWAGMHVRCEVFGLFSRDIPQEGLAMIERGRKRQGIVPDFLLPASGGNEDATLADLKFVTGTVHHYPRHGRQQPSRAVDRRAQAVNREYQRHAVALDTKYCGIPKAVRGQLQQDGPVQRRLASYGDVEGWCFGVWGEASEPVHQLIHSIVEARLRVVGQHPGRRGKTRTLEGERAQLVGSLRRQVSLMAVRANARLILSRMESFVGPGAAEAARRRQMTLSLERQEARERQAHALSLSQGRNILRRGFFHVN